MLLVLIVQTGGLLALSLHTVVKQVAEEAEEARYISMATELTFLGVP